ncbi:MAG: NUDIX hydrolase [Burkholderiaceae bacterium]
MEPDDARLLARSVAGLTLDDHVLALRPGPDRAADPVSAGAIDARLAAIAHALRDAGRLGPWRGESLPVLAADGAVLGRIERATMRVLGLRTIAVHLLGRVAGARLWVQRRAPDKAVDPGRLDSLAGGLVGLDARAGDGRMEALDEAMRREAAEEAGIDTGVAMRRIDGPALRIVRPLAEGYMVEDLVGFEADFDTGFMPRNRDGEVTGFECLDAGALVERIGRGEFTLAGSLLILRRLRQSGHAGSGATGEEPRTPPAGPG